MPARRIGIEIAADEIELADAALELADAIPRRHARRLRQLADADEILREKLAYAAESPLLTCCGWRKPETLPATTARMALLPADL